MKSFNEVEEPKVLWIGGRQRACIASHPVIVMPRPPPSLQGSLCSRRQARVDILDEVLLITQDIEQAECWWRDSNYEVQPATT
jgi:hypothetical protein